MGKILRCLILGNRYSRHEALNQFPLPTTVLHNFAYITETLMGEEKIREGILRGYNFVSQIIQPIPYLTISGMI